MRAPLLAVATASVLASPMVASCSGDQTRPSKQQGSDASDGAQVAPSHQPVPEPRIDDSAASAYRELPLDSAGKLPGSGTLEVIAAWNEPPAAVVSSPGLNSCGAAARPPVSFIISGKTSAVTALTYALVGLERVSEGRPLAPAAPLEVTMHDCRIAPVVAAAARPGSPLAVSNLDERRHELLIEHLGNGSAEPELLARLPMALVGQRFELPLSRPGLVRLSSGADHAYVAVSPHPYQAAADARGIATLEQVPAGSYDLWVWHPPLERGGKPLLARAPVKIEAGKTTTQVVPLQ